MCGSLVFWGGNMIWWFVIFSVWFLLNIGMSWLWLIRIDVSNVFFSVMFRLSVVVLSDMYEWLKVKLNDMCMCLMLMCVNYCCYCMIGVFD